MKRQVAKLRNLTSETIGCFGTSGELVLLPPEPLTVGEFQNSLPEKDTYYLADNGTYQALLNSRYNNRVAKIHYIGQARNGTTLCRFRDDSGNEVKLITEGVVENPIAGTKLRHIQFAYESLYA